jgi:hypothetical protein
VRGVPSADPWTTRPATTSRRSRRSGRRRCGSDGDLGVATNLAITAAHVPDVVSSHVATDHRPNKTRRPRGRCCRASLPSFLRAPDTPRGDSASFFALGVFSGIGSSCCGPVLAGVMTLSALSG